MFINFTLSGIHIIFFQSKLQYSIPTSWNEHNTFCVSVILYNLYGGRQT